MGSPIIMHMSQNQFTGVFTAIITPFKNGKIDYEKYFQLLDKQIKGKVSGVVPCGTTGESPTLNTVEHSELIKKTVDYVNGRIWVVAGTGSNSTSEAIHLTQEACKDGVDAVLSMNPYYNKPTQEGLFLHFSSIAQNSTKPVMLYNIPGRTAVNMLPDTIKRLTEHKNIQSVKEASGDLNQMARLIQLTNGKITVLSGDDNLTLPLMAIGGNGVVSVASNIFPATMVKMIAEYQSGNVNEARKIFYELFRMFNLMFMETNPIPIKAMMHYLGLCEKEIRSPLTWVTEGASFEEFKKEVKRLKDQGFE